MAYVLALVEAAAVSSDRVSSVEVSTQSNCDSKIGLFSHGSVHGEQWMKIYCYGVSIVSRKSPEMGSCTGVTEK